MRLTIRASVPRMAPARYTYLRGGSADLAATLIPIVLVVYLGLTNGGFDPISRSAVGIGVWWLVIVGTAVNVLPAPAGSLAGRLIFLSATAFAGWTALAFA